jgi:polysaccharide pyruvyl transferase WcaK-like protein
MGDEVIYLAHRQAFPDYRLVHVAAGRLFVLVDKLTPRSPFRGVMLGGGTLIGHASYRRPVRYLSSAYERLPVFMLGTGVEDPEFIESHGGDIRNELQQWAKILRRVDSVAVRGPRSQAILAELGVKAQVLSDPALLPTEGRDVPEFRERLLGVNLGVSRAMWGRDPEKVLETMAALCRQLRDDGWRIRFVPLWPRDIPYISEAARRVGSDVEIFTEFLNWDRLATAIGECHAFVGQKLHSVVFSSGLLVPSLMIEYHPKCADFQLSIQREDFVVRTDRLRLGELVDKVEDLATSRESHTEALRRSVSLRREQLLTHVGRIRKSLEEPSP